jgi:predicted transposase/invertase (TIGR01784 family)
MPKINPRVDFAFKILFGSEENKDILLPFINAVLAPTNQFAEIELLNPYNHKTHSTGKLSILDIKAKDKNGKLCHIEMQMNDRIAYDQHALYYWSKIYSQQLSEGQSFSQLRKTISIHVLNFNHLDELDYHNIYHLLNTKTHSRYSEDLELHFIELKKFDKDFSHLTTALDRWASFLTRAEQWERNVVPQELKGDPAIEKAAHALDTLSLDKEERELYEAQLKWLMDQAAILEKKEEDSIEIGKEIGRKEGEAIGLEKGEVKGVRNVALRMLKKGTFSIEAIAETTGLSDEAVQVLANEMSDMLE